LHVDIFWVMSAGAGPGLGEVTIKFHMQNLGFAQGQYSPFLFTWHL